MLDGGSLSFGAYYQRNHEWRPNMIPLTSVPLVDIGGLGIGLPYSQRTSGFYATLPRSVWHKTILINNWLLWSHLHLNVSKNLKLSNMIWVRIGKVRHLERIGRICRHWPARRSTRRTHPYVILSICRAVQRLCPGLPVRERSNFWPLTILVPPLVVRDRFPRAPWLFQRGLP